MRASRVPVSASRRACSAASVSARFSMRASFTASAARNWSRSAANSATDIGNPASIRRRASLSVRRVKAGQIASQTRLAPHAPSVISMAYSIKTGDPLCEALLS